MRWTVSIRGLRRIAAAGVMPAGLMAAPAEFGLAQAPPTGLIAPTREAAQRTEPAYTNGAPATGIPPSGASGAAVLTRTQRRDLEQARRQATDLADRSASAFERGLMPLGDYLEQATLVQWTEQLLADVRFEGDAVAVRRNHLARMQSALGRLRQFNQPNAKRWEADVALAEWAVADAELQLANAEQDSVASGRSVLRRAEAALDHNRLRQRDADIGWASLQATSRASAQAASSALPDSFASSITDEDHRMYLAAVAWQTSAWERDGAGIGRADRVQKSDLAVEVADLNVELQSGRVDHAAQTMRRADREFQDLFTTQQDFHAKGTASLYDLSRTWLAWRELHDLAADKPGVVDADQVAGRERARSALTRLADQTVDRRGRHAADVTVVRLIQQMDGLEALRRPLAADSGEYLK